MITKAKKFDFYSHLIAKNLCLNNYLGRMQSVLKSHELGKIYEPWHVISNNVAF